MTTKDDMCKLPSLAEAPWLILTHEINESELENQTFCSINNNKSYIKTIVELQGKSILASNQGWLILQERVNPSKYSLWNPVTRHCLLLPELLDPFVEDRPCTCIFTSAPDGNDTCVVLLFYRGFVFSCRPTMRDDCTWVKQSLEHDGQAVFVALAATINGDIYAHSNIYNDDHNGGFHTIFARLKVTDNDNSDNSSTLVLFEPLEIRPARDSIKFKTYQCSIDYLVEVCGVLYAVHILKRQLQDIDDYDIVKTYVWRLDMSEMEWIQVESLGDRAFLLGNKCCTWCWANNSCSGIEGNCVYMTSPRSKTMHQYRLQDDSYIFLKPYPNLVQNWYNPIWFMPYNLARSSSDTLITEKLEDNQKIKHVGELEEAKMDLLMDMPTSTSSSSSLLCELPSDVLISITVYLHLFDYMSLRATCKILRSAIPPPKERSDCSYPLFMSRKNNGDIWELWDPCQNIRHSHTIMIPYSPDMLSTIEFYKDGWLLLRTEGHILECFNPFDGKRYKYPSHDSIVALSNFAFSTCPTSPDCLTVGIYACNNWVEILYFQAGNDQWKYDYVEFEPEEGIAFKTNFNSSPVYYDGAFYFLDMNGNLGVFEMDDDEKWYWWVSKGPIQENISLNSCYLVELDGELIYVFIEKDGRKIQVFMFDTFDDDWVELDDLGEYMLFVSPASSFSVWVSTKDGSMRNRIYLPKRIDDEMVFYSLNTGMYHTSTNNCTDFYGMSSQSFCCWL